MTDIPGAPDCLDCGEPMFGDGHECDDTDDPPCRRCGLTNCGDCWRD